MAGASFCCHEIKDDEELAVMELLTAQQWVFFLA